MNIKNLLEEAFETGAEFARSQAGGTIDELYSDNGRDFFNWYQSKSLHIALWELVTIVPIEHSLSALLWFQTQESFNPNETYTVFYDSGLHQTTIVKLVF